MPRTRRKIPLKTLKKLTSLRLPILFILAGVLLILFPTLFTQSAQLRKSLPTAQAQIVAVSKKAPGPIKIDAGLLSKKETVQPPERIVIPKYKVDLGIVEAPVINGLWEISEVSASHGVGSANPGENGNVVVFAHARDELFGPLRNIQKGDKIYILTKDRWAKYEVAATQLVNPDQIEVIAPTRSETLTLFTCSGFLDTKRLIVKALPV